jgi:peptidoglycan/xylan/chitin deacetylase (PgdA/CDA1 family)
MGTGQLANATPHRLVRRLEGSPVLTYHGITDGSRPPVSRREQKYWISASQFQKHVEFFRCAHCQVTALADFWSSPAVAESLVVLTFDDGRASDYEMAFPRLLEAGFEATFFVNTATIGSAGHLTWSQIQEMHRFGMAFQSHSHDHLYLSELPPIEIEEQLVMSKQLLEDRLGTSVSFLATPYGDTSNSVATLAIEVGYRAVCTSRNWPAKPRGRFISRAVIYGTTTTQALRLLVDRSPLAYCSRMARTGLLCMPKELLSMVRRCRRKSQ